MVRLDPRLRGFATDMRNAPTKPEAVLWSRLRSSQLGFKFRRQAVIGAYIVDFCCPAVGLIVELDGWTHRADDDVRRDATLAAEGFKVMRFGNSELSTDLERVVEAIYRTASTLPVRFGHWSGKGNGLPSPSGEGPGVGNEGAAEFVSSSGSPTPGPAAPSLAPPLKGRGGRS